MSFCTKCGKQNPDTAKFCIGCGTPFKAATTSPAASVVQKDTEPGNVLGGNKKSKRKGWIIVGIVALLGLGAGAYFIFLKPKKREAVMMVVPDVLKLRSSKSDVADDNVLGSYSYGTSVTILDSSDIWYSVKLDGKKGYMHSKHLCTPTDFVEINAIIQSGGLPSFEGAQRITESRFKRSLLQYFRNHNYISEMPADEKEKYFSKEELATKQVWRIKSSSPGALAFIKGNFTYSDKKGIAIIIENALDPSKRKLLVFNYNTDETEAMVSEFDESNLQNIWLGLKGSDYYTDFNANTYKLEVDIIFCNIPGEDGIFIPFYVFRDGKMEKDFDYQYGD